MTGANYSQSRSLRILFLLICALSLSACGDSDDEECPAILAIMFLPACFLSPQATYTGSEPVLEEPAGVSAEEVVAGKIEIKWKQARGASGYRVYRNGEQIANTIPA